MATYTTTLTEAENKALSYTALAQQEWIDNAVHERCRVAIDEIVNITVQKCLETNTAIPGTKDAMVDLAFAQGWVKTAAEQKAEVDAIMAARLGQDETNTNV
jgi:primosomal protein N'